MNHGMTYGMNHGMSYGMIHVMTYGMIHGIGREGGGRGKVRVARVGCS